MKVFAWHRALPVPALLLALGWLLLTGAPARALMPPRPGEIEALRASGQYEKRRELAESSGNQLVDPARLAAALAKVRPPAAGAGGKSAGMAPSAVPAVWKGMPSKGNVKCFALLIDFADRPGENSRDFIHERLFGAGDPLRFPADSLASFYDRSSYGQLSLYGGTTLGWYHAPYSRSAVPMTDAGREALIKEAIGYFKAQGHDFSPYDSDGDGVIDYFMVIWSGPDNGWSGFWWSWKLNFSDPSFSVDGKRLWAYSWNFELNPLIPSTAFHPGHLIHETGHALGLPDYYDYGTGDGPRAGMGGLDMMDGAWGDHNCFSKWLLDWITPTVVAGGSQRLTLNPSGTSRDAVLIMPGTGTDDIFGEFFMAQNRYRKGNDLFTLASQHPYGPLPADGMLVWHIDARLNPSGDNFLNDQSPTGHRIVRLMEADGLEEIDREGPLSAGSPPTADAGDYYTPGGSFTPLTLPSSASYDGGYTGVSITDITSSGEQMSASFAVLPGAGLRVTRSGSGLGSVVSAEGGIDCGADCGQRYQAGSPVTLHAQPGPLSSFTGWGGACTGTGDCALSMTAERAVSAGFALVPGASGNLLANPGFEAGREPWAEYSSGGYPLATRDPGAGQGGSDWYAFLAGYDGARETLQQEVTIPAQAQSASLSFWYRVSSQESPWDPGTYDRLAILVVDPADPARVLAVLGNLSEHDAGAGWSRSASFDLSSFRGSTVRLTFLATNDESNPTGFKIDDVELTATVPGDLPHTLTLTLTGSGAGAVNSVTPGVPFSCASAFCSAEIPHHTSFTLAATPGSGSGFGGWSGACSGAGDCLVTMDGDRSLGARFDSSFLITTAGKGYGTLQSGYDAAAEGDLVKARGVEFVEDLRADRSAAVRLQGGYDGTFSARAGFTTLRGRLAVSGGTLRVEGLKVR